MVSGQIEAQGLRGDGLIEDDFKAEGSGCLGDNLLNVAVEVEVGGERERLLLDGSGKLETVGGGGDGDRGRLDRMLEDELVGRVDEAGFGEQGVGARGETGKAGARGLLDEVRDAVIARGGEGAGVVKA